MEISWNSSWVAFSEPHLFPPLPLPLKWVKGFVHFLVEYIHIPITKAKHQKKKKKHEEYLFLLSKFLYIPETMTFWDQGISFLADIVS